MKTTSDGRPYISMADMQARYADPAPPQADAQPVAWGDIAADGGDDNRRIFTKYTAEAELYDRCAYQLTPLYTHADAGEVERLREVVAMKSREHLEASRVVTHVSKERDTLRAQLAERDALLREMIEHDYRFIDARLVDFVERMEEVLSTASPATINQQGEGV